MKKLLALFSFIFFSVFAFAQKQAVKPPFSKGVNFSVWLQADSAGAVFSNYFVEQDFKNVKAMGCDVIRLPVHFENLSSGAPDYIIDKKCFELLDKAVKWASEQEIYLVLDNHSWSPDKGTSSDIEKRLLKYWPQIANHFKDSDKYVMYEILNEPHEINNAKWGKIQQKVIDAIRAIDKKHTIVVGGAEWNSVDSMILLPKFSDDNLIYTFHYYAPMMFTHQGASWSAGVERFRDIPFPYAKERMPKKLSGASSTESWYYDNYKQDANPKTMQTPLDKVADFSIKRNAPVWCGEFGVYMQYANNEDRAEWYRTVTEYFDERNIARTSWDYYDSFGIFKKGSSELFPNDVNPEIMTALKYTIPSGMEPELTWDENAKKNKEYVIYSNGFVKGLRGSIWAGDYGKYCSIEKPESSGYIIDVQKLRTYQTVNAFFVGGAKLLGEKYDGYYLEFEARTSQKDLKMQVYFMNSQKSKEEWRASADITNSMLPADGKWHKIKIPLMAFRDIGAWNNERNEWINSKGLFDWDDIARLVFDNTGNEITQGVSFREIRITK